VSVWGCRSRMRPGSVSAGNCRAAARAEVAVEEADAGSGLGMGAHHGAHGVAWAQKAALCRSFSCDEWGIFSKRAATESSVCW